MAEFCASCVEGSTDFDQTQRFIDTRVNTTTPRFALCEGCGSPFIDSIFLKVGMAPTILIDDENYCVTPWCVVHRSKEEINSFISDYGQQIEEMKGSKGKAQRFLAQFVTPHPLVKFEPDEES